MSVVRNPRAPSWGLFVVAAVLACSGRSLRSERIDPDAGAATGGTEDPGGRGGASQGGSGLTGFGGGSGGTSTNAGSGGDLNGDGGTSGSGGTGGAVANGGSAGYSGFEADPDACASLHLETLPMFPRIFIAVDRSSAMAGVWSDVSAALTDFLSRPELDGAYVALRFFPDDEPVPSCDATTCNATACQGQLVGPARLSSAPLAEDDHERAMVSELENAGPADEEAPLAAAFEGLALAAAAPAPSDNPRRAIALFVTAGVPSACDGTLADVARMALEELGVAVSIAVPEGVSPEVDLDAIAMNAGTYGTIRLSRSAQPLLDILPIPASAVACDVPLPTVEGRALDFDRTIAYAGIDGAEPKALLRVSDVTDCGMESAWYFNDNDTPDLLFFCPTLCSTLISSYPATFDAYFYCERGGLGGP